MILKSKILPVETLKPIVFLNDEDASELDVMPLDRITLKNRKGSLICIVNVVRKMVKGGEIGVSDFVAEKLRLSRDMEVSVDVTDPPESINAIKSKMAGNTLEKEDMLNIVKDVVEGHLSDVEITAFVIALQTHGMSMAETAALSNSMVVSGETLNVGTKEIYDKHSIGGVAGDKTTMIVVPIVAAAGLTIPKTSSRAITSPAGTADRVECICPVELGLEEIKRVVKKTNGCMVWGGALDLAPADDIFIRIEYPLSIDPLLLPSVMSKKKAVNAKYVVIDIPTGRGTKIKSVNEAAELSKKFMDLGTKLGIKVNCLSTFGEQPIGHAVGPVLEAREALLTLMGKGPPDLVDKAADLAGVLLGFKAGKDDNKRALEILKSGKALKKFLEIVEAQGGNPMIKPENMPVGSCSAKVSSNAAGKVLWVNNNVIVRIAKAAGTPKDKGAGVYLYKKIGDVVKKGDVLLDVYAESQHKLSLALKAAEGAQIMGVGDSMDMTLAKYGIEEKIPRYFVTER
jgi:AMP phosphorylase